MCNTNKEETVRIFDEEDSLIAFIDSFEDNITIWHGQVFNNGKLIAESKKSKKLKK